MTANKIVALTTRARTYDTTPDKQVNGSAPFQPSNATPRLSNGSLQIEKPIFDNVLRRHKGSIRKSTFNPNVRASQNYNIVENLAHEPCAMSTLEVLKHYPSWNKTFLSALGAMDPKILNYIMFNLEYFKSRLSHHLSFQIHTNVRGKSIHHTMIDEGASTCVMALSCWRAIGFPDINQSPTTLKAFDGPGFKPYEILNSFPVELGGKIVSVNIEVVDAPFDYNLLLGHSWFYAMIVVTSLIFFLLQFPHQGQIVTINQLDYCTPSLRGQNTNNVPFVEGSKLTYEHVGVGLLTHGNFTFICA